MSEWPDAIYQPTEHWPAVDLIRERLAQREEWSEEADDALLPAEWLVRIHKHLGRAVTTDPETYRRELVVSGALILAALDAYDRRYATETWEDAYADGGTVTGKRCKEPHPGQSHHPDITPITCVLMAGHSGQHRYTSSADGRSVSW